VRPNSRSNKRAEGISTTQERVETQCESRSFTSFRMTTPLKCHSEHTAKNLLYCDFF
jgi:hypothetical protein